MDIIPSAEFAAACRILLSGDTPDIVDAVFRSPPLLQQVKQIKADILAGRRAVSFPLDPPPGQMQPGPFMLETIRETTKLRLSDANTRAAIRGRLMTIMMARVGARMAAQRDKTRA